MPHPQLCSSHTQPPCPHLGWPALGGDVGHFKVTGPTKAPLPQPPILASSYLALSCPLPAEAEGHYPSRAPRARPHPPAVLSGTLVSTKLPKTSPAFEASNPYHLSVCPLGPSSRGTTGDIMEATVQMGLSGCGMGLLQGRPGKSPLIPSSQPAGSARGQDRTNYLPNCMVLKAPRHPRAPLPCRAAVCMTGPPTRPFPSPPLLKKERKKRIHNIYIYTHIYIYTLSKLSDQVILFIFKFV